MKHVLALSIVILLGLGLRLYKITTVPPSLSHDETAIAYNAYSILKTGRDEYGEPFPLLFRSFDDYKLPGMVYSTVPFVALFGTSELSARLPSALYGLLSIIVIYLIVLELTSSRLSSLISAFVLAVQPWHINFSRQLFESNGAVFWFMLGIFFLLQSRKQYKKILWAGLSFVVSLYFYYSVRLVIPFVLLTYVGFYWKTMIKNWNITAFALLVCFLIFFPMGKNMLSPGGMERISIVSVVNDKNYIKRKELYVQKMGTNPNVLEKIIYNRRVALFQTIVENYAKNISWHNLFVTGTGTYGALYPFEILFLPLGIFSLIRLSRFHSYLILVWFIASFFPGAFSVNQPNTLRTLVAAPIFAILSGLALRNKYVLCVASFALLFSFPKFYYAYFVDNPTNNAISFGDGYKQMVQYIKAHESEYEQIYISGYYWRPYIFMLYWGDIAPTTYQQFGNREKLGKYTFTAASWDTNGIKLMDPNFDFVAYSSANKTLFILSFPEYTIHEKYFRKIAEISGRHTPHVFIAATLK